jgi:hypothetical protein
LKKLSENKLKERIKTNFKFVKKAMQNRENLADSLGLEIYSKFLEQMIFTWNQWVVSVKYMASGVPDPKTRLELLLPLAATVEGLTWDENVRLKYPGITSNVSAIESMEVLETKLQYSVPQLISILKLASIKKRTQKNFVWNRFYDEVNFPILIDRIIYFI